ncbi:unnamed protein product [Closterium sp. Yama58-4]|nr:unnamed protein product [Closterium sp. Yama58-4]
MTTLLRSSLSHPHPFPFLSSRISRSLVPSLCTFHPTGGDLCLWRSEPSQPGGLLGYSWKTALLCSSLAPSHSPSFPSRTARSHSSPRPPTTGTEILVLGDVNHPNHPKPSALLGYCMEGDRASLVYELAERGSLHHWLHPNATGRHGAGRHGAGRHGAVIHGAGLQAARMHGAGMHGMVLGCMVPDGMLPGGMVLGCMVLGCMLPGCMLPGGMLLGGMLLGCMVLGCVVLGMHGARMHAAGLHAAGPGGMLPGCMMLGCMMLGCMVLGMHGARMHGAGRHAAGMHGAGMHGVGRPR